jgi:hypothetical protein
MWNKPAILPILLLSATTALAQDSNVFRLRVGTAMTGSEEYQIVKNPDGYRLTGTLHTVRPGATLDFTPAGPGGRPHAGALHTRSGRPGD